MTTPVAHHRSTAHKLAGSAAVLSLALLATTGGTFAGFSSSAPVTNEGLETGSLKLSLTEPSTSIMGAITGLAPGDTITRLLQLNNVGKGSFTPTLTVSVPSGNLLTGADGLNLLVEQCGVAWTNVSTCSTTVTQAYSGDLVGAGKVLNGVTLNGNSTAHLRTTISMPANAADGLAGLSTGALTFTYSGAFVGGQSR